VIFSINNLNFYPTTINNSLQKVDYQYNVRGWLTDINNVYDGDVFASGENDLFKFKINYDGAIEGTAAGDDLALPLYNGNISQTIWRSAGADDEKRGYGYRYDAMNRIKSAYSRKGETLSTGDHHSLLGVNYDRNGNILSLKRNGVNDSNVLGLWDDLIYNYSANSNQLNGVVDLAPASHKDYGFYDGNTNDYAYDDNGNMTRDRNKGITNIDYNHLNLPTGISIDGTDASGTAQEGRIAYIYDATGVKLQKTVQDVIQGTTVITSYAGGYIYEEVNGLESLKMFAHPEGYVEPVLKI